MSNMVMDIWYMDHAIKYCYKTEHSLNSLFMPPD